MRAQLPRTGSRAGAVTTYVVLILTALAVVLPLVFIFLNSFKAINDFYANVFGLPKRVELGNYPAAWKQGSFFPFALNSLIVTSVSVLALVFLGALASYPIARRKLFGATFVYVAFLSGLMIPAQVIAIPLFIIERKLLLLNSLGGLAFVYIATELPITVFIFVGFMRGIPVSWKRPRSWTAAPTGACCGGSSSRSCGRPWPR